MYEEPEVRIGALYGLYCMYYAQPKADVRWRVRVDLGAAVALLAAADFAHFVPDTFRELNEAVVHAASQGIGDPVNVMTTLLADSAFEFCAQLRFGVGTGDAVGRDGKYAPNSELLLFLLVSLAASSCRYIRVMNAHDRYAGPFWSLPCQPCSCVPVKLYVLSCRPCLVFRRSLVQVFVC